ncbi:MAG: hypothetical protein Q4F29_11925 [Lachnospiraceae bacterium]|nr:hypothetical protein [Lachnospiraceae bacterium]
MENNRNHTDQYWAFRKQYPEFIYKSYEVCETEAELKVTYHFQITGLAEFAPTWRFPKPQAAEGVSVTEHVQAAGEVKTAGSGAAADGLLQRMIFSLGMVELVSYWKITCSPRVLVQAGTLDEKQIAWWKDLYFNGLGEFFYVNQIEGAEPENFMEILADGPACPALGEASAEASDTPVRVLVPIGGGKDSVVTLELLKEAGEDIYGYIINPRGATVHTAEVAGLSADHVISARRTLDKNMLELNQRGFLNGHTPFSAIVSFSALIAARLYHLPFIALSNESSANESTVQGSTVNHQYSKSFKYEQDFHNYAAEYLPGSSYYFSMLRPLSEFQIARYFAGCKAYHGIFRSCNVGSKADVWCGHCPKCLFVYLILSPFLEREAVQEIFGTDMLEDETMLGTLEQLVGIQEEKPFECVGSRDEINTAIMLTIRRMELAGEELPKLFVYYKTTGLYERYLEIGDLYSSSFDEENLVPEKWKALVRNHYK